MLDYPKTVIILTRWSIRPDGLTKTFQLLYNQTPTPIIKKSVFNYYRHLDFATRGRLVF